MYVHLTFLFNALFSVASTWKPKGIESKDSDEEWVQFFNREDIDDWELSRGLKELYCMDLVPDPKIVVAMIRAARRLNDVALAIRVLEVVKEKACGNQRVYSYVMDEVNPLLDELGLKTLEELGLD